MKTSNLYPDDIPIGVFDTARELVKEKGMTLKDAIEEIESIFYIKLPVSIIDKLREEVKMECPYCEKDKKDNAAKCVCGHFACVEHTYFIRGLNILKPVCIACYYEAMRTSSQSE